MLPSLLLPSLLLSFQFEEVVEEEDLAPHLNQLLDLVVLAEVAMVEREQVLDLLLHTEQDLVAERVDILAMEVMRHIKRLEQRALVVPVAQVKILDHQELRDLPEVAMVV